jgi:hypothetical protein
MHGGKNPGAPTGERNGNYRHGRRTKAAQAKRREWQAALASLKRLLRAAEE